MCKQKNVLGVPEGLETRLGGVCEWGREQHRGAPEAEGGWVSPVAWVRSEQQEAGALWGPLPVPVLVGGMAHSAVGPAGSEAVDFLLGL